ncbi:hypothetical protein Patl1_25461 [Pistacia atlantica]|uniref:Uncharacterized protein n=1 Tax=Pistacia atlantica TaxID=434234 RepID=A0ACC1B1G1_9ROSI|nr:hypothetical protein Patl1_25461 [Pistacia atlantica]
MATLHYRLVYRVRNHAFDLAPSRDPDLVDKALFLKFNNQCTPSCTYVPRQIPRPELLTLMPERWLTAYKTLHPTLEKNQPIQTTCTFKTLPDGTVETRYERETPPQETPACFPTQFLCTPLLISPPPRRKYEDVPITSFDAEGAPVYAFADLITGHKYFDLCDCEECLADAEYDMPHRKKESKANNSCKKFKDKFDRGDLTVGTLGQPSGKYDYFVSYGAPLVTPNPSC